MGRKTWDSIPPRFRPLKGRLNVVVSRSFASSPPVWPPNPDAEPVKVGSLEQAVEFLRGKSEKGEVGRVFVVGGGQIYDAALGMGARRVLLTRVEGDFECDTHFGLRLGEVEGWVRRGKGELDAWVGEEVPGSVQREGETEYEFQMWERVD